MPKIQIRQNILDRIKATYKQLNPDNDLVGNSIEYQIECILDSIGKDEGYKSED